MTSRTFVIRSLNMSEMLDEAFHVLRAGLWTLILFQLLISVPGAVGFGFLLHTSGEAVIRLAESGELSLEGILGAILPGFSAVILTTCIIGPISSVAFTRAVSATYLGRSFGIGSLLRDAIRLGPRAIIIQGLLVVLFTVLFAAVFVLLVGGFLAFQFGSVQSGSTPAILGLVLAVLVAGAVVVVAGVYLVLRFGLALTAYAVEELKTWEAFRRSEALMRGRYLVALGILAVVMGVTFLGTTIVGLFVPTPELGPLDREAVATVLPQYIRSQILSSSLGSVIGGFTSLYGTIVWTLFYFSARCDREGFDLTVLAERLRAEG